MELTWRRDPWVDHDTATDLFALCVYHFFVIPFFNCPATVINYIDLYIHIYIYIYIYIYSIIWI